MPDGQIVFEISADGKKAIASVKDVTDAIQKETKKWDQAVDESAGNMQKSFTRALDINRVKDWALKAGKAMLDFGMDCVNAASDLAEVQNVVDTTFGESAAEIDSWARNAITQFGLTETKAKQFASTMGAMMKSSGVASKDIVEMSENLAGLAADMSSFYNLDFDEAFNKIRSGISGETEPLKQLGINMSQANLEAFALAKGIDKAFSKMSQGEQIMIRYQYLMEATADAQGDFAKTSDGFANGLRLLESNFESLKTVIGNLLIQAVEPAINGLNDMLALLLPATKQTTVLDDFANIDLKAEEKVKEVQKTKDEALALLGILDDIKNAPLGGKAGELGEIAEGANALNKDAGSRWKTFINGLNGVGNVITASDGGTEAGEDLKGLATGGDAVTGKKETFKYENLPKGIKDLIDNATGGKKAGEEIAGLSEADKVAGDKKTFKFSGFGKEAKEIIDNVDGGKTAGQEIAGLAEAGKVAGDKQNFKFSGFGKEAKEIIDNVDGGKNAGDEIAGLAKAKDVSGTKENFKFSGFGKEAKEIIDNVDGGVDAGNEIAGLAKADKVAGNKENFKFSGFGKEAKEVIDNVDGGIDAGKEIAGLAKADDVSGKKETFKFSGFGKEAKEVIDNVDGGIEAGKQIEGLAKADAVAGDKAGFKFSGFGAEAKEVIDNANGGTKAGKELSGLAKGAKEVSGDQEKKFTFSALTDSNDGVGKLIDESDGGTAAGTNLKDLATGAMAIADIKYTSNGPIKDMVGDIRLLKSTDKSNWEKILNIFKEIPGYTEIIDTKSIENIAGAFSGLEGDKATAWKTLMDSLGSNTEALTTLTGQDAESAAKWLADMKEAANGLNNEDVDAWDALLSLLAHGTPGAGNYVSDVQMAALAKAAGMSESAVQALGDSSTDAARKQEIWLETCRKLVKILPGLSSIIDTETGEIKGGTKAVKEYIDEWEKGQKKLIALKALEEKEQAVANKRVQMVTYEIDFRKAQNQLEAFEKEHPGLENYWYDVTVDFPDDVLKKYKELTENVNNARDALYEQGDALKESEKDLELSKQAVQDLYGSVDNLAGSLDDGSNSTEKFNQAQKDAAKDGVKALGDALKEVNDYIERTKKSTEDSIDSALKGFKKYQTAREHIMELEREQKAQEQDGKLVGTNDTVPSLTKMQKALEDQADFMIEYQDNLAKAKARGVSEDLLAEFASDFSQENADFLYLIANAGEEDLKAFKDAYKKMSDAKDPLVKSMTELKLQADDEFNELVAKAKEAAIQLNNADVAKESMAATVGGIAEGIRSKVDDVGNAVDALNAELARLGSMKDYDIFGGLSSGGGFSFKFTTDGSFAKGTDYIPFDNYLAYLHEGEAVLTAEEAAIWRNFKNGGSNLANTIDYGQLSGAIWDNAPNMRGNVYLDGRTVGAVLDAQQANRYRSLERSGWQG